MRRQYRACNDPKHRDSDETGRPQSPPPAHTHSHAYAHDPACARPLRIAIVSPIITTLDDPDLIHHECIIDHVVCYFLPPRLALNIGQVDLERLLFETNNPKPTSIPFIPLSSLAGSSNEIGHIYLGNARNAMDLSTLLEHSITHVVNATDSLPNHFDEHATYLRVVMDESNPQFLSTLDSAVSFIKSAIAMSCDHNVLVHCQHGISCSATVVTAFFIREMGWNTEEAIEHLQKQRFIRIFPGLQKQLKLYEASQHR